MPCCNYRCAGDRRGNCGAVVVGVPLLTVSPPPHSFDSGSESDDDGNRHTATSSVEKLTDAPTRSAAPHLEPRTPAASRHLPPWFAGGKSISAWSAGVLRDRMFRDCRDFRQGKVCGLRYIVRSSSNNHLHHRSRSKARRA